MNIGTILLIAYTLATSLALIFLKLGTQSGAPITFIDSKIGFNLGFFTISGVVLYGLSFLIYTYLIAKYDLGFIIPIATALVYVVIFVASFIIFKESFTMLKIIGIILILVGIVFINLSVSKDSLGVASTQTQSSHRED